MKPRTRVALGAGLDSPPCAAPGPFVQPRARFVNPGARPVPDLGYRARMTLAPEPAVPRSHRLRDALLIWCVWTALGLYYFSQAMVQKGLNHDPTPWTHTLAAWLVGVWVAALATPVNLWLGRRFPLRRGAWAGAALAHAVSSVGLALAQLVVQALVLPALHVYPAIMKDPASTFVLLFVIGFHQAVITYWVILALQAGASFYRGFHERRAEAARLEARAAELQSQLASAQLGALKAQLQPHFLFNTLNAIVALVRQGRNAQAEAMLGRLADLLRFLLEDSDAQEVPLRRELEYLRLYLAIEEVRFQDRLRTDVSAGDGLLDALVPHLCLQPVVENAIRHGLGRSATAGRIAVRARREGASLVLSVEDDGPGLPPPGAGRPPGIGLANTRARLARLHGDAASLRIEPADPHGVVVTMTLPYRTAGDAANEDEVVYALHVPDRR